MSHSNPHIARATAQFRGGVSTNRGCVVYGADTGACQRCFILRCESLESPSLRSHLSRPTLLLRAALSSNVSVQSRIRVSRNHQLLARECKTSRTGSLRFLTATEGDVLLPSSQTSTCQVVGGVRASVMSTARAAFDAGGTKCGGFGRWCLNTVHAWQH